MNCTHRSAGCPATTSTVHGGAPGPEPGPTATDGAVGKTTVFDFERLVCSAAHCPGLRTVYAIATTERMHILAMASLMTLLVGLSRIALGVHWPPDGLTGW